MATINQEQIHIGPSPGEIDAQGYNGLGELPLSTWGEGWGEGVTDVD
jgi:hypothetical protein